MVDDRLGLGLRLDSGEGKGRHKSSDLNITYIRLKTTTYI